MKYQKGSFITVPNSESLNGIHATAQCLFMWLCHHANQDGKCFPSRRRLAELCGASVDTIDKMTLLLIEKNLITKTIRKKDEKVNNTNLYEVIIGGVAAENGHLAAENGQGVAAQIGSELNPLSLTQSTEVLLTQKTEKFIQELKETMKGVTINKTQIEEIKNFISYWTEPDKNWQKQKDPKIRYDHQKTWDMKRRVATWMKNSINFGGSKQTENKYKATMV
jgi:hypothetical protein